MVKFIETELEDLGREVDQMWTLVYNQMEQAQQAVLDMDRGAAQQIMVRERRVDAFELKIDSDVEDFIALYTPVAVDLRYVLSMLKINNDLERIGDYADGIARFVRDCDAQSLDPELVEKLQLRTMFSTVLEMLKELPRRPPPWPTRTTCSTGSTWPPPAYSPTTQSPTRKRSPCA